MKWRIYYADGSTFDNTDGEAEEAPAFGVICIVFPDTVVGRVVMWGWDWYYYETECGQWWGSDIHGLLDGLLHGLPRTAYKQGRNIHNAAFKAILNRAVHDPDFPRKSARKQGEHP